MELEVNIGGSPARWVEGSFDYCGPMIYTFDVDMDLGPGRGKRLVCGLSHKQLMWSNFYGDYPVSADDAPYLSVGRRVIAKSKTHNWYSSTIVTVSKVQTDEYHVRVGTQWKWTPLIVPRSKLRSCPSQEERQELARLREQQEQEELRHAVQQQCQLRDTADVHCSRAWDRGNASTIRAQSELVWRRLHDVLQIAGVTLAADVDFLDWDAAAALARQDGGLRTLAAQLSNLPASIAAHIPPSDLSMMPSPSFEQRVHDAVLFLQKDIKQVEFLGNARLSTPNESDKQVRQCLCDHDVLLSFAVTLVTLPVLRAISSCVLTCLCVYLGCRVSVGAGLLQGVAEEVRPRPSSGRSAHAAPEAGGRRHYLQDAHRDPAADPGKLVHVRQLPTDSRRRFRPHEQRRGIPGCLPDVLREQPQGRCCEAV
jgi:hypothetical protein